MHERRVVALALSSLHTILLLGTLVLLGLRAGTLGAILQGTGTLRGVLLFLALWALAAATAWWGLRGVDVRSANPPTADALVRGVVGGAAAGFVFVVTLLLALLPAVAFVSASLRSNDVGRTGAGCAFVSASLCSNDGDRTDVERAFVSAPLLVIAGSVAGVVGAAIGLALAALDLLLIQAARRLVEAIRNL